MFSSTSTHDTLTMILKQSVQAEDFLCQSCDRYKYH